MLYWSLPKSHWPKKEFIISCRNHVRAQWLCCPRHNTPGTGACARQPPVLLRMPGHRRALTTLQTTYLTACKMSLPASSPNRQQVAGLPDAVVESLQSAGPVELHLVCLHAVRCKAHLQSHSGLTSALRSVVTYDKSVVPMCKAWTHNSTCKRTAVRGSCSSAATAAYIEWSTAARRASSAARTPSAWTRSSGVPARCTARRKGTRSASRCGMAGSGVQVS